MTPADHLQEIIDSTITALEHVRAHGMKREYSFTIDCAELADYNEVDIRQARQHQELFAQLEDMNGPALYLIEVVSATASAAIIELFTTYKASPNAKATPALKATRNHDSRVLYVGKVKKAFWGRLIQHLGFYKVRATQGLQLFYWAKDVALQLRFTVLEFDEGMANIMPLVEYAFAQRLRPLIGKHQ